MDLMSLLSSTWKVIAGVALLISLLVSVAFAVMSATARRPKTLGVSDGRLAPCPDSPNCVSTRADREQQRMDSISLTVDAGDAMAALKRVVSAMSRAEVITADDNYLHAEFTSALFRFVDDVELFVNREERVIHFRSASRSGRSDFGVNRKRMQVVVAAFQREIANYERWPKTER